MWLAARILACLPGIISVVELNLILAVALCNAIRFCAGFTLFFETAQRTAADASSGVQFRIRYPKHPIGVGSLSLIFNVPNGECYARTL